jgi:nitroimidazol reductase NimA-like FMN-containing flavoprotein (pyridoxamine 5'-phosphate oxidase superfamily)
MSLAMSRVEREQFLAAQRVGIVSVVEPGRGPLTLPIWYAYEPGGEVRFLTAATSRKAVLIRQAGRVSLCVQNETPPYQYVSVEGPVTVAEPDYERDVRPMAYRYLGEQLGDWYLQATAEERARGTILFRLKPARWLTVDYNKMPR